MLPAALDPLLLGALLGWAGAGKLTDRTAPEPDSALMRLLPDTRRVALAVRLLGAVEIGLAAGLLVRPMWTVPGYAATVLGVGYLGWAPGAPESSCGCTSNRHTPITARSFGRAGLVVAGGLAAAVADRPWWTVVTERPAATGLLAAALVVVGALAGDLDEIWLLPLRRARLRLRLATRPLLPLVDPGRPVGRAHECPAARPGRPAACRPTRTRASRAVSSTGTTRRRTPTSTRRPGW